MNFYLLLSPSNMLLHAHTKINTLHAHITNPPFKVHTHMLHLVRRNQRDSKVEKAIENAMSSLTFKLKQMRSLRKEKRNDGRRKWSQRKDVGRKLSNMKCI